VILEDQLSVVLEALHDNMGHTGITTTYERARQMLFWPKMHEDVERHIQFCDPYQRRRPQTHRHELQPIPVKEPFHPIGIDCVGPLNMSRSGNKYIVVCTDYLTKWPEAQALPDLKAGRIAQFLIDYIVSRHGCPYSIISDQGSHFHNELIIDLVTVIKFSATQTVTAPIFTFRNSRLNSA
jgi:Integrase zinc binding domain